MIQLSVIVPTRSRYENLNHVLESLFSQSLPITEYEVIVVDDNSTDATQTIINTFRSKGNLKYIFSNVPKPHTWNASVIRNLGALAADQSSKAYVFVDSDVVLPNMALQYYLDDFRMNPNRVVIGSYDFTDKNGNPYSYPNGEKGDVRSSTFREFSVEKTTARVTDGLACFGGNILMPKDIFWSVGGFSDDTHIGLEDGDMGLKLWKKGTQFSYDDRLRGTHRWHEIPQDRFPSDMKEHIDKLNLKHFGTTDPDYGIVEASRETYAQWGITGWEPPKEWLQNQLSFGLQINKS